MPTATERKPLAATKRILNDLAKCLSRGEIVFPTFVDATCKIRSALDDPNMNTERLARVISTEPLLAAKLVHFANSVALNPSGHEISDVTTAVSRIGFKAVRVVATAIAMRQMCGANSMRPYRDRAEAAWRHSVQVAAMAFVIAQKLTRHNPDEALFTGLVHDIGYFYILSIIGRYPELSGDAQAIESILREQHPSVGKAVLKSLKLSDSTLLAVGEHENGPFSTPPRTIVDIVICANMMAIASNPIYRDEVTPPERPDAGEIGQVLAEAAGELTSLVAALRA